MGLWKVIVLFDGVSPSTEFSDDLFRIRLRKWVGRHVDAVITNTFCAKNYLEKKLQIRSDHIHRVVYQTAEIKESSNEKQLVKTPMTQQEPTFLYVGQLIERKGVDFLLMAWAELERITDGQGSLWIVGDGPQRAELEILAKNLNTRNVTFIGNIEYSSLDQWYEACDVFIFPTLEDIWAVVVLEAMAHGKAVLCSKYAGAVELIEDGKSGFIFDPRSKQELVRAMLKFTLDPDLSAMLGERTRLTLEPFTARNAAKAFESIIENI